MALTDREKIVDEDDFVQDGLLHVFHDSRLFTFVKETLRNSMCFDFFGGPLDGELSGITAGPISLHHIATFMSGHVGAAPQIGAIPLVYGMCFDGCQMAYKFNHKGINVTRLRPRKSSEDWPYANYPRLLPYFQLKLAEDEACGWSRFADLFINQPDKQPADIVAVVPPPFDIGMTLWGHGGELEDVQLVFECDLDKRMIAATNHCT